MSTTPKRELPPEIEEQLDLMVANFKDQLVGLFRFYGMEPIEAVVEILEEIKRPLSVDDIARMLKAGGISMGVSAAKGGADGDLKRSIGYYTGRSLRIREVNGLIGLVEWPDDKFGLS